MKYTDQLRTHSCNSNIITFFSCCSSWDRSMTSVNISLHFEDSVSKAKTCVGGDLRFLELKTLDLSDPDCPESSNDAAS